MYSDTHLLSLILINSRALSNMDCCKLCVAPVLSCKDRRRVDNPSLLQCRAVLFDLVCDAGGAKSDASKEYSSGFICKKCFNLTTKYSAPKENLDSLKSDLQELLCQRSSTTPSTSRCKGTKRAANTLPEEASGVR